MRLIVDLISCGLHRIDQVMHIRPHHEDILQSFRILKDYLIILHGYLQYHIKDIWILLQYLPYVLFKGIVCLNTTVLYTLETSLAV